jgi:hypothetical protein
MYNECDHDIPLDFSKQEFKKVIELNTTMKFIRKDIGDIKETLNAVCKRQTSYEESLWKFGYEVADIKDSTKSLSDKQFRPGIGYLLKTNWRKIAGFVLSMSAIFGVIGEYLYHLPPPR